MPHPFGSIFAEEIIQGHKKRSPGTLQDTSNQTSSGRYFFLTLLLAVGVGLLIAKLFLVTVFEGNKYYKLSAGNRIREANIAAPRGIIYDRNAEALVRNIPQFTLAGGEIFYETLPATSSVKVKESIARDYVFKEALAHIIGFVGEADKDEIKSKNLSLGEVVGKIGIEKAYDSILRGVKGKELVEVDALENQVRILGKLAATAGESLTLTIDSSLQQIAAEELADKSGAVIATNPKTGEILTLYSSPSFDPNKLIKRQDIERILAGSDKPLFNRAISGLYPPGSTFKIVTAIAALESGAISKDAKIEDIGILTVGKFSYANWYFTQYGKKEGMLDIIRALKRSNDIFFYKAGEAVGIETLAAWAKKIGLGNILGIDIEGEAKGVMPDPAWRKKVRGGDWFLGDTYHVAIGQGDLQVTPLQVNAWTNVIASGGRLCRPHLRKSDSGKNTSDGVRQLADSSEVEGLRKNCRDLGIKKETIDLIKEGMRQACSPGGTGWPLFKFQIGRPLGDSKFQIDGINFLAPSESTNSGRLKVEIPTACKTGTAEFGDPNNRTHAWFTVFAPVTDPQISVTVLVEGGGEGSSVAGPIAKRILEGWFGR